MIRNHWSDIGSEPNESTVINWRKSILNNSHAPPIYNRIEYLKEKVKANYVLDIGVVDHKASKAENSYWLHNHVVKVAKNVVGIDKNEAQLKQLRSFGYNVKAFDIEKNDSKEHTDGPYDVILCGEVIEHLGCPNRLFEFAVEQLKPRGVLILTTPNPFSIWTFFRHLLGRPNDNADHVTFAFPSGIAELSERNGMLLQRYRGTLIAGTTWKHHFGFWVGRLLNCVIPGEVFCTTMIYEVERVF